MRINVEIDVTPDYIDRELTRTHFHEVEAGGDVLVLTFGRVKCVEESISASTAYRIIEVTFPNGEIVYYRKDGYISSYDGLYWDGVIYPVVHREVTRLEWVRVEDES